MKAWWLGTAWPWLREHSTAILAAWWDDLGEHPGLHFLSMLFGMVLLFAIGFFL